MVCFLNKALYFVETDVFCYLSSVAFCSIVMIEYRWNLLRFFRNVSELGWSTHGSFSTTPSVSDGESSQKANSSNSSRTASNASQMEVD